MAKQIKQIKQIEQIKQIRQNINGVFLLNKDSNISSQNAMQQIRRLFNAKKAGHIGTLDPLATGVLPICFGDATKFSQDLNNADKTYIAEIQFGVNTDTCDADGQILENFLNDNKIVNAENINAKKINEILVEKFSGEIIQTPPQFSAIKINGQKMYQLAREGVKIDMPPRKIKIYVANLLSFDAQNFTAKIEISCSKGTYIRSIARDLGNFLHCGGYLKSLQRTKVGEIDISETLRFETIKDETTENLQKYILPIDFLIQKFVAYDLAEHQESALNIDRFLHGNPIIPDGNFDDGDFKFQQSQIYRIYNQQKFIGTAEYKFFDALQTLCLCPLRLICSEQRCV